MKMDSYYKQQGYERISLDQVTGLDDATHHGIDGVYYNPNGNPPYIIGEAKYGSSKLGMTKDGELMSSKLDKKEIRGCCRKRKSRRYLVDRI